MYINFFEYILFLASSNFQLFQLWNLIWNKNISLWNLTLFDDMVRTMAALMHVITAVILITYSRVSVQIRENVEFGPSPIIAMSYILDILNEVLRWK